MTQEDKILLLRDLCGRLPYGVKAYIKNWSKLDRKYYEGVYTVESIDSSLNTIVADSERSSVEVIVGGAFSYTLVDYAWEGYVNTLKIKKWAYISDLLPKGEERKKLKRLTKINR